MTRKKIPDTNIYPDSVDKNSKLLAKKIDLLIETIKRMDKESNQSSIGKDSGVGISLLGRLKGAHQYTYFDSDRVGIDDFVRHLSDKYPWLNLTTELFWAKTSDEEFNNQISIRKAILPANFYSGVPRPDYEFSGRESDIESLTKLIENTVSPRINITGPACIGKTALLIELAGQVVGPIFNKVVWVTARKKYLSESDLIPAPQSEIVLESILNAIIVQNGDKQDVHGLKFNQKFEQATKLLSEQKLLLLIDNFELVNDSKIHDFLLNIPAPSKVIVTSRDRVDGFKNYPITRMQPDEVMKLIDEQICSQDEIQVSKREKSDLENICDGNLVAIKWILGQIATLNLRLYLIIKDLQSNSNTYILDHIFQFSFSKLDSFSKVVLITLANAPIDVTGNLIANSIVFIRSEEEKDIDYGCPEQVEKSLGLLVKLGLVSELKNDQRSSDARISLSSKYRISFITGNYVKSKFEKYDKNIPQLLFKRFCHNLLKYDLNSEKDNADLIEFLIVWANIAIAILNGLDLTENPRELMRIYVLLRPFLGIVHTKPHGLPIARFNVNATLYNADAGQTFIEFVGKLLLKDNEYQGRTDSGNFTTTAQYNLKDPIKFNKIFENSDDIPLDDHLVEGGSYEDYVQISATIIYKKEDIEEISPFFVPDQNK